MLFFLDFYFLSQLGTGGDGLVRMTVRNIEATTHAYLTEQAAKLSSDGNQISVNQLIGSILNQYCHEALLNQELNEIQKLGQRFDYLLEGINELTLTYQELIDVQK